jgi:hypothetical protein
MGSQAFVSPSPPAGARATTEAAPLSRAKNLPQKGVREWEQRGRPSLDRRGAEMDYAKTPLDNNRDNNYITIRDGG